MDDRDVIPDDAFVVRGGRPRFARPLTLECRRHPEGYSGISVQAEAGLTVSEPAGALPNKRVGFTTAGEVRNMGYDVAKTSGAGFHATLMVPDGWTEADASRLARSFQVADNPNPTQVP